MGNIPLTSSEYRVWWLEQRPGIPYGLCWCGCGRSTWIPKKSSLAHGYVAGEPVRFVRGHGHKKNLTLTTETYRRQWLELHPEVPYGYCCCGCRQPTPIAKKTSTAENRIKGEPIHFIHNHHSRSSPMEYIEEDRGYDTPCWIWQRYCNSAGYGQLFSDGRVQPAHRIYYERRYGPMPKGLEPDHLCLIKSCINPEHIEAVTHTENTRRAPHCKLNLERARQIRTLRHQQRLAYYELAQMFGVSLALIGKVINEEIWRET